MPNIAQDIHRIEELESSLLAKEGEILDAEQMILSEEKKVEKEILWLKKANAHRLHIVRRLAKHKFVFSMIVTFGVVLLWRGMWGLTEMVPVIKETGGSLFLGFGILWFLEKYSEG